MHLNQQLKLQWSVLFLNGPVTTSVTMKTTTLSVLMEAIVVIMLAKVGTTAVS